MKSKNHVIVAVAVISEWVPFTKHCTVYALFSDIPYFNSSITKRRVYSVRRPFISAQFMLVCRRFNNLLRILLHCV